MHIKLQNRTTQLPIFKRPYFFNRQNTRSMNRKDFFKLTVPTTLLMANGKITRAADRVASELPSSEPVLRFAVASDGHYGLKGTPYQAYFSAFTTEVNKLHAAKPFAFCVVNGDIIHDDKKYFPDAKKALDELQPKYYVSQGNHDHATEAEWQSVWNMPVNLDFSIGENSFLVGTTSNEKGTYLCPNLSWMEKALEKNKNQKNIFIFLHINSGKLTTHAVDCPDMFTLLAKYRNVRAIFNGHDHDEDHIKLRQGVPFVFDAHFGGNWGTEYLGFRVVELFEDNTISTYIHNPFKVINKATL